MLSEPGIGPTGKFFVRAVATLTTGATLAIFAANGTTACVTHSCDESFRTWSLGKMVDEDTWESNGLDDTWLPYPGRVTWTFELPEALRGRNLVDMQVYVAVTDRPNLDPGHPDSWALAIGNLAEWRGLHDNRLVLYNGTCGEYSARIVLRAARRTPSADASFIGSDARTIPAGDASVD